MSAQGRWIRRKGP